MFELTSQRATPRSAVRLVVFDMAGTTVRDDDLVLECFVKAATRAGITASSEAINARMGASKRAVFDALARAEPTDDPEGLRDRAYKTFRELLEAAYEREGARPVEGAERAFAWLRERGVRAALNTGFYREVTELLVAKLGWVHAVDAVVCDDDVREGRPAPFMIFEAMQRCDVRAASEVMVVGDTPSDMLAGRNAGVATVVGVTSGSHRAPSLWNAGATHVIASVAEVPALITSFERARLSAHR